MESKILVGDTVSIHVNDQLFVGIVIEIRMAERYDRNMRIRVAWTTGGMSYEKEASLKKLN